MPDLELLSVLALLRDNAAHGLVRGQGAEGEDRDTCRSEHGRDELGRTVPDAQPDDFWRSTQEHTAFVKVRIFGDDDQVLRLGELPNRTIHG